MFRFVFFEFTFRKKRNETCFNNFIYSEIIKGERHFYQKVITIQLYRNTEPSQLRLIWNTVKYIYRSYIITIKNTNTISRLYIIHQPSSVGGKDRIVYFGSLFQKSYNFEISLIDLIQSYVKPLTTCKAPLQKCQSNI